MDFYKGESRILYLRIDDVWHPIGCLTSNTFSETSEFIDTTTRDNQGWGTSRPILQNYTISFDGLQVVSDEVQSYHKLKILKRDKTLLWWKIGGNFPILDYGMCYINGLSESAVVDELLTFTGDLIGFGKPLIESEEVINLMFQNGENFVFQNNNNFIV